MATKRLIDAMRIDFDEVDITECTDVDDIIFAVEKLIDAQPAVDAVEVVHGRWIEGFFKNTFECSVCFEKAVHHCYNSRSNYCPNCGAKMEGDGDGT